MTRRVLPSIHGVMEIGVVDMGQFHENDISDMPSSQVILMFLLLQVRFAVLKGIAEKATRIGRTCGGLWFTG